MKRNVYCLPTTFVIFPFTSPPLRHRVPSHFKWTLPPGSKGFFVYLCVTRSCKVETESDGTRRSTGGEVKGKEANGVGSQHSCTVWEHGLSSIISADAHTSAASSRLN